MRQSFSGKTGCVLIWALTEKTSENHGCTCIDQAARWWWSVMSWVSLSVHGVGWDSWDHVCQTFSKEETWTSTESQVTIDAMSSSHPIQRHVWAISAFFFSFAFCGVCLLARLWYHCGQWRFLRQCGLPYCCVITRNASLVGFLYCSRVCTLHCLLSLSEAHWARGTNVTFISRQFQSQCPPFLRKTGLPVPVRCWVWRSGHQ